MLGYGIADGQCTGNNQIILGNTNIAQVRTWGDLFIFDGTNSNGNCTIEGNVTLGDASTDNITLNGTIVSTATINNTTGNNAISITDGGGDVKLSYESLTVSSNAVTISDNVSVAYITSDNNTNTDVITIPTGSNGKILYVVVNDPYGNNASVQIGSGGPTIPRTAQTMGITLVYANGAWQIVGVYQY
jgi:hypothetical protein